MWKRALPFISEYAQESLGLSEPWGYQAKVFERRRSTPPFFLCFVFITSRRIVSRSAILRWPQVSRQICGVWRHEMYCRHHNYIKSSIIFDLCFVLVEVHGFLTFLVVLSGFALFCFPRSLNNLKCPKS